MARPRSLVMFANRVAFGITFAALAAVLLAGPTACGQESGKAADPGEAVLKPLKGVAKRDPKRPGDPIAQGETD